MTTLPPAMALTKLSHDSLLMPPPPAPKRIKRPARVLDEDDYTDALSHIIARDFFPGLLETEFQQEYLEAIDSEDPAWIASAGQKLNEAMTPGPDGRRMRGQRGTGLATPITYRGEETPRAWQGDTPMSVASSSRASTAPEVPKIDTNMSLGAFQQKYTSEDNESFYKLLDKQNKKRAEKYAWVWAGNKIPAARQIAHRERERLLAGKASAETAENDTQLIRIESDDKRQAMPDTWKANPRNTFMFAPESVEDDLQTVAQKKEETSLAPPRAVAYDNTRMPQPSSSVLPDRPSSPTLSTVMDAIAGRPRPTASEASFSGASTPRVKGYAFVDSEEPEAPPPLSHDPLLLTAGESTPNPFKLNEGSKREALHHRMVDKISKGKRARMPGKRQTDLRTPNTPKFLSSPRIDKRGGLTPAAERLLGKVGGAGVGKTPTGIWEGRGKAPKRSGLRDVLTPTAGK